MYCFILFYYVCFKRNKNGGIYGLITFDLKNKFFIYINQIDDCVYTLLFMNNIVYKHNHNYLFFLKN